MENKCNDSEQSLRQIGYMLLRITMGINILVHGLVRIPKIDQFNTWMVEYFQDTMLPEFMVSTLAYTLPYLDVVVGILLILGLFTSQTIIAGAITMIVLIFGSCLKENWEWVSIQMLYAIFYFLLAYFISLNKLSIDTLKNKGKTQCKTA